MGGVGADGTSGNRNLSDYFPNFWNFEANLPINIKQRNVKTRHPTNSGILFTSQIRKKTVKNIVILTKIFRRIIRTLPVCHKTPKNYIFFTIFLNKNPKILRKKNWEKLVYKWHSTANLEQIGSLMNERSDVKRKNYGIFSKTPNFWRERLFQKNCCVINGLCEYEQVANRFLKLIVMNKKWTNSH